MLRAVWFGLGRKDVLELGCAGEPTNVSLTIGITHERAYFVERQLLAAYPECRVERSAKRPPGQFRDPAAVGSRRTWFTELWLAPDLFSLRSLSDFDDPIARAVADPLTAILTTLRRTDRGWRPSVAIEVRRAPARRVRRARRLMQEISRLAALRSPEFVDWFARSATSRHRPCRLLAWVLTLGPRRSNQATADDRLRTAHEKLGQHLFEARLRIVVRGPVGQDKQAAALIREMAAAFGQFTQPALAAWELTRIRRRLPTKKWNRGFLLSADELAALWHPPTSTVRAETLATVTWRQQEPPPPRTFASGEGTGAATLGRCAFRHRHDHVTLGLDDRRRHLHIVGKTGMGKSTLLLKMLSDDIAAGRGAGLIDPHGDLVEAVLARVPRARTNDVALFDAGERTHPVAFNPLACDRVEQRPLVADGVLAAFKRLFGDSWGPRMEDIFRNAVLALTEIPDATLLSVLRLLTEARFRRDVAGRLTDPVVRTFWEQTFASWNDRYRIEAIAPVENKVRHFTSNPILRGILGQPRSSLDLRQIMDRGQVLLVNLSKGRIGDDASKLLGSLLTAHLQLAAMGRAELPEAERRDFFVCIDEFQSFLSANDPTVATILSESRKFRLSLTLAHQFLEQLDEATRAAVFGNVGSLVAFQVGANDAETLAAQFGGDLLPNDLMNVPRYTAYARLLLDGQPTRPFSLTTLPPSGNADPARADTIRRVSRRRYSPPTTAEPANRQRSLASIG